MASIIITKVGVRKETPRIWFEGKKLEREGFSAGTSYKVDSSNKDRLVLVRGDDADRTVSSRTRKGKTSPIIDLNAKDLAHWFDVDEKLRIAIRRGKIVIQKHFSSAQMKSRLERIREKIAKDQELTVHSLFHGAGVLDTALHAGLARAGVGSYVQVAVELDRRYLDLSIESNPDLFRDDSVFIEGAVEDVKMDNPVEADILVAGIPCTGASLAGRAKMRDTKGEKRVYLPEEHDSAGALFFNTLRWVEMAQPAICVFENVKDYQNTASMAVIRSVLGSMGYAVQEVVLNGNDYGALENRDRLCVVATTKGLEDVVDLDGIEPTRSKPERIADVLEPIALDDLRWKSYDYLREKEKRDMAAGKGFRRQLYSGQEPSIATVTREYNKCRSTDPFIQHPEDETLSRLLTPREHARVKGISESLIEAEGLSVTLAHEALGQSVIFPVFEAVGFQIGAPTRLHGFWVRFQIGQDVAMEFMAEKEQTPHACVA